MSVRPPLSRDLIISAAVAVADGGGLEQVTMRNVGKQLGVEAMSLYHHLPNKAALVDALADWVFTQIDLPAPTDPWRQAMTSRAASARTALSRHPWALGLIESRPPGPALLTHHESVLACLRRNGFPVTLASHAFSAIDSYVYGYVITELSLPFDTSGTVDEFVAEIESTLSLEGYPHLKEVVATQVARGYSYGTEFHFGLDLILDSLARHLGR